MVQRIVITGAQSTGKTTLLKRIISYLKLPCIEEIPRKVASLLGIPKNGRLSSIQRLLWQEGIIWWQISLEETFNSFISDRSLIDHWAYTIHWLGRNNELNSIYELIKKQVQKYTHIIYIPPILPFKKNGFRSIDLDYINNIDNLIQEILEEWFGKTSNKIQRIKDISLDKRVEKVLRFIHQTKI
jgi:nicotinamide riboside kinase